MAEIIGSLQEEWRNEIKEEVKNEIGEEKKQKRHDSFQALVWNFPIQAFNSSIGKKYPVEPDSTSIANARLFVVWN